MRSEWGIGRGLGAFDKLRDNTAQNSMHGCAMYTSTIIISLAFTNSAASLMLRLKQLLLVFSTAKYCYYD